MKPRFAIRNLYRLIVSLAVSALLINCLGCSSENSKSDAGSATPAIKTDAIPAEKYTPSPIGSNFDSSDSAVPNENALIVRFIDVGQGDAALITCGGESLLIDGGPADASSKMYTILKSLGIRHLDYVIATHPDADHCGGIAGALNYADCGTFFCSVTQHTTKTFNSLLKYLGSTPVTVPEAGTTFMLGKAYVEFLTPNTFTGDTNNGSLVCKISLGSRSFLFTGDAEFESEMALVNSNANIAVDVLKVGHHGSSSSSNSKFLECVAPDYAIISVGNNDYGHPTSDTLERLSATDALILRTDQLGTITFETDGESLSVSFSKNIVER